MRASADGERALVASLLASFAAYLVAAGIDWVWELTAVSVVGMLLLGLLTGPATAAGEPVPMTGANRFRGRRLALGILAVVGVWAVICAQALPLLADVKLSASATAVRNGDGPEALGHAEDARRLEPWAASPYLQLALVHEAMDDLPAALVEIRKATDRDPLDWRLWLARARIETNSGEIADGPPQPRARRRAEPPLPALRRRAVERCEA